MKNTLNKKYVEELINRGKKLEKNEYYATLGHSVISYRSGPEFDQWFNEIIIFKERYLKNHPLYISICNVKKNRKGYNDLMAYLGTLVKDEEFWEEVKDKEKSNNNDSKQERIIFLSHKSDDKKYGDALRDFIIGLGVKDEQLIYTSHALNKIPMDKNIYDYLRAILTHKCL